MVLDYPHYFGLRAPRELAGLLFDGKEQLTSMVLVVLVVLVGEEGEVHQNLVELKGPPLLLLHHHWSHYPSRTMTRLRVDWDETQ